MVLPLDQPNSVNISASPRVAYALLHLRCPIDLKLTIRSTIARTIDSLGVRAAALSDRHSSIIKLKGT